MSDDPKNIQQPAPASAQQPLPQQLAFAAQAGFMIQQSTSPLPPPEMLAGYARIAPDFPDRILRMAEAQMVQRHRMEEQQLASAYWNMNLGSILAFGVGVGGMVAATLMARADHAAAAAIVGSMDLVALASAFIQGRRSKE